MIALTPSVTKDGGSIGLKLFGVGIASLSSGMGELSMLGLTHYYGHFSLAAWGSGTGGAGLIGAGLYVFLTDTLKLSIKNSLLTSAYLPFIMPLAFFLILPQGPLRRAHNKKGYTDIPQISIEDEDIRDLPVDVAAEALLAPGPPSQAAEAYTSHSPRPSSPSLGEPTKPTFANNLRRARRLFFPYMLPLRKPHRQILPQDFILSVPKHLHLHSPSLHRRIHHKPRRVSHPPIPHRRHPLH